MTDFTTIDAFLQSSPHPAWLSTSRNECLYINPALERLSGLKSDQIKQVDWLSFVLEEDRAAASVSWQSSLDSGAAYRTTVRLRGFDGVPVAVEDGLASPRTVAPDFMRLGYCVEIRVA